MTFKERYGKTYSEIWTFHEKHYNTSDTDAEWEQIIRETDELYQKHKGKPEERFFKEMIMVILDEIEREAMQKRENSLFNG